MSDRPKSTNPTPPPHTWENGIGFHEALLRLFAPEDAAALRRLGQMLYEYALGIENGPNPESLTRRELRAALVDLELLRDYLVDLGLKVERTNLEFDEARLCVLAAECGEGVRRIVDAVKAGLS